MFDLTETFSRLGIALGLGLLVGLQRQRTDARLAGFRTFPLVTLLGSVCGLVAQTLGGWVLALAFGALALVIVGGNRLSAQTEPERPGVTTEVAMLVMFSVGAYLMMGSTAIAIAIGGLVAVLLDLKPQMHTFASRLGDRDFTAMMRFVLISLVILPVLPNRYFGPFQVLNPFKIWLMVVLIVGISLGGYIIYKLVGARAGVLAGGVLGGLISSTATTVGLARRSRRSPEAPGLAAFVILVASAIVFVRVGILIGSTAPQLLRPALVPLAMMFCMLAGLGWWNLRGSNAAPSSVMQQDNPAELKPAILFGVMYALVLLAVAAGREFLGEGGLYAVALLSGLTDMDAITLSVTQLVNAGQIDAGTGWRVILAASLSNLLFKTLTVAFLADRRLLARVGLGFGIAASGGGLLLATWPD